MTTELETIRARQYPKSYSLYLDGKNFLRSYVDKDVIEILDLPSVDFDFGFFFSNVIEVAKKNNLLTSIAIDEMSIMLYWVYFSWLLDDGEREALEYAKIYKKATGINVPVPVQLDSSEL